MARGRLQIVIKASTTGKDDAQVCMHERADQTPSEAKAAIQEAVSNHRNDSLCWLISKERKGFQTCSNFRRLEHEEQAMHMACQAVYSLLAGLVLSSLKSTQGEADSLGAHRTPQLRNGLIKCAQDRTPVVAIVRFSVDNPQDCRGS